MSVSLQTTVQGAAWLNGREWGCLIGGGHGIVDPTTPLWKDAALFPAPPKNLGRFDAVSKSLLCVCALALKDAGYPPVVGAGRTVGLVGTNETGCLTANRAYFKDYLDAGRTLARANLFVYTLPSSPLAEASIHFGLRGPMLYTACSGAGSMALLETAALLTADGAAEAVVAVRADERDAVAYVVSAGDAGMGFSEAIENVEHAMKRTGCS